MDILRVTGGIFKNAYIGFGAIISYTVSLIILLATVFNTYKTDHAKKILDRWTVCAATPYIVGLLLLMNIICVILTRAPLYMIFTWLCGILLVRAIIASIDESKMYAYEHQLTTYKRQREHPDQP